MTNKIASEKNQNKIGNAGDFLSKYGTIGALVIVFVLFAVVADEFLRVNNLINVLRQISTLAIVAFGMTICMSAGDFDMSVGNVAGLAGVVATGMLVNNASIFIAFCAAVLTGIGFGLLNGITSTRIGIPSIIVTLGTSSIAYGIIFMYTGGKAIYGGLPSSFTAIGRGYFGFIPIPVIIMAFIGTIVYLFLNKTIMGRYIYAVGGNSTSAKLSGINTSNYRTLSLVASSFLASLAGIVLAARLGSGQPAAGEAFTMDALAAIFIGMTTIKVGSPNIIGTFIGVVLIGLINNGLNLLGLPFYVQDMAKGIIMISAVAFAASKNELKFFSS